MEVNKDKIKISKGLGVLRRMDEIEEAVKQDAICFLDINLLDPFPGHPFKLYVGKKLENLCESIKKVGVLEPIIVRKVDNRYQILAGHNRHNASKICNEQTIKSIVVDVDDDTAKLIVVDTNFRQRDEILPSEKAFAYKMKLEALIHQGKKFKNELNPSEKKSRDVVAEEMGESGTQVQRYIRLTDLTDDLLNLIDEGNLGLNTGVELSYLKHNDQELLFRLMKEEGLKIKLMHAVALKRISTEKSIEASDIMNVVVECPSKKNNSIRLNLDTNKYFPGLTEKEIMQNIIKLIEANCSHL